MNVKRSVLIVLLLLGLLVSTPVLHAQDTPIEIRTAAVNTLNAQIPGIGNPQGWQHTLVTATDTSLGCPLLGSSVALPAPTTVYAVTLFYPNSQYVLYVSADASQVVPCDPQLIAIASGGSAPQTAPAAQTGTLFYHSTTCPADFAGYTAPRLYLAGIGRVTDGGVNNIIRQNYGRSSQPTGAEMPPGSTFPVVGGPECTGAGTSEAIVWWQVTYNGVTGWTAESLNGEYFLELVDVPTIAIIPSTTRQPINASNAVMLREIGQNVFTNQYPIMNMGKDGVMVVGTAQNVFVYSSTSSGRIGPVGGFTLEAADYYEALSPAGDIFATTDFTASATEPGTQIVLWDTASITERMRLPAIKTGALRDIVFNSDATRLYAFYEDMMAVPSVPYITLYDLTTGQSTTISALAYSGVVSPDNKLLATSDNQQVYLWDAATLTQLVVLNTNLMPVVNSGANAAAALAFSPDGSLLAVGGETGTVQLWNVATRTLQATLTVFQPGQATVLAVAFSPDGKLLAATGGFLSQASVSTVNGISVFDLTTNSKLVELTGHTDKVFSLAFSPDGTLILSAGDTSLRAWGVQ